MSTQPKQRILTIEDDPTTAQEIAAQLTLAGYNVEVVHDGKQGLQLALTGQFAAITLDRTLPYVDGLTLVSTLRAADISTPVLMISALSAVDERVRGLRAGGDDYLIKPFDLDEMQARLEVLLRRQRNAQLAKYSTSHPITQLTVADLNLQLISRMAMRNGCAIALKSTEFRLLEYMMKNADQVLTRSMIFEAVWQYNFDPYTNLIEVHMARLRKKINLPDMPVLLHTVRGSGYLLGLNSDKNVDKNMEKNGIDDPI